MGAARYIGRVGGLAVALGIGLVVFTGPGVASADSGTSARSSTSESAGSASPAPTKPTHPKTRLPSPVSDFGERRSTAAQGGTASAAKTPADAAKPTTGRVTNRTVKSAGPRRAAATDAPRATTTAQERISQATTAVADDVSKPRAETAPKETPADSPASWVALAATRRELGTDRITYTPTVTVSDGVITGTNQGTVSSRACRSRTPSSALLMAAAKST